MNKQKSFPVIELIVCLIVILCTIGWIWNIVKIFNFAGEWGGEIVLRIIGIFAFPLGIVLGFL